MRRATCTYARYHLTKADGPRKLEGRAKDQSNLNVIRRTFFAQLKKQFSLYPLSVAIELEFEFVLHTNYRFDVNLPVSFQLLVTIFKSHITLAQNFCYHNNYHLKMPKVFI